MASEGEISMTTAAHVADALAPFSTFKEAQDAVAVHTYCLYPDNAVVTVWVRGGPEYGFIASDEGRAIDELTVCNRQILNPDKFLSRFCHREGLVAEQGKIRSRRVTAKGLAGAVSFVANASASAVSRGLELFKVRRQRNLKADLGNLLGLIFPVQDIKKDVRFQGRTTRFYRFESVVELEGHRRLIVDSVTPDGSSINAHAVAHFDIGRLDDDSILQRIVYDDRNNWHWRAADLNLLQMAATIVPFSESEQVLQRFQRGGI